MGVENNSAARDVEQRRKEHYHLLFAAQRGSRYHLSRERFFLRCQKLATFVTAIVGSGAFVTLGENAYLTAGLVGLSALAGVYLLVVKPSESARRHGDFARECTELEREARRTGPHPSAEELAKLIEFRLDIEAREPAVHRVLDALCHDELIIAKRLPKSNLSNVTLIQRMFAQWYDLPPRRLDTKDQM